MLNYQRVDFIGFFLETKPLISNQAQNHFDPMDVRSPPVNGLKPFIDSGFRFGSQFYNKVWVKTPSP
jgi:hypothetical protein